MSNKLFIIATVVVSLVLTFAPAFAQDTRDTGPTTGTATADYREDDNEGPDFGWLGLLGLVGLGGLMRRNHTERNRADRELHR
jgi:MYXO-CTERM domain-containing protein